MRNPNGYGSVVKLSGNRRNPYGARLTVGFKAENGFPIYKFIGYYPTRKEAMTALGLYHNDPSSVAVVNNTVVPTSKITLQFVYDEWSEEHFSTLKNDAHYRSAFKVLEPICNMPFATLTINDYEKAFRESGRNFSMLKVTKIELKLMYQFAFRKGYIEETKISLPSYISLEFAPKTKRIDRRAFAHEEIATLWKHKDDPNVQLLLFMIYTGLRISEAVNLKKEDVKLEDRYMIIRKAKTEAGVRNVPIAERIVFIVENWLQGSDDALVPFKGNRYSVKVKANFNGIDEAIKTYLGGKHEQHETRHTMITLLTEAGVDLRYIKLIAGHAQKDVTNNVYAKRIDNDILKEAIDKI